LDMTYKFSIGGEETIARLREINPDVKIIICTAYSFDPVITDFTSHGFSGVLIKPFTIDDLERLLAGIFQKKR
jgi:CheY-like chemotaxis protein